MTTHKRFHPGELLISLVLIAIGSFVVFQTQSIAETQGFSQVGPRLFPNIIPLFVDNISTSNPKGKEIIICCVVGNSWIFITTI